MRVEIRDKHLKKLSVGAGKRANICFMKFLERQRYERAYLEPDGREDKTQFIPMHWIKGSSLRALAWLSRSSPLFTLRMAIPPLKPSSDRRDEKRYTKELIYLYA